MTNANKIRQIAVAIYTVNRHAKTASNNKELYELKKLSLEKLLRSGEAIKVGLHFVENPKFSKQHSTTLVRCGDFLFHMIPEKEDFQSLPHLGHQDQTSRNPQERMSIRTARKLLTEFLGITPSTPRKAQTKSYQQKRNPLHHHSAFRSSYLDG